MTGHANFIEINPLPGLNPLTGDLVVMTKLLGLSYQDLIGVIVEETLRRYAQLQ
jgi:D-alanine-D-alanine ligase